MAADGDILEPRLYHQIRLTGSRDIGRFRVQRSGLLRQLSAHPLLLDGPDEIAPLAPPMLPVPYGQCRSL